MTPAATSVKPLLQELEDTLKAHELWQSTPITPEKLYSTAPFCCDTLRFEQWLQFVFIPKMLELLAANAPLPNNMAIAPMAEMSFAQQPYFDALLDVLTRLDASVSDQ